VACLPVAAALAADTNSPPAGAIAGPAAPAAVQPAAAAVAAPVVADEAAPAKLPYGVADVLKLTHAQVSEEVVLNYVLNSGTVYNLGAKDIVYLRNQGVSDRVLTTMMNQRNRVAEESAQQAAAQAGVPAPGYADAAAVAAPPPYAPAYVEPPPVAEPAPSTVYVVPYSPPVGAAYYGGYYPHYYGGYYAPGVSFVYRFGPRGYYGGHPGGSRGGYYHFGGRRR